MTLTKTQRETLQKAAENQVSAKRFRFQTVRKLLDLDLVEGVGDGEDFGFWATEKGREWLAENA